jgi:hypothetical protein
MNIREIFTYLKVQFSILSSSDSLQTSDQYYVRYHNVDIVQYCITTRQVAEQVFLLRMFIYFYIHFRKLCTYESDDLNYYD